MPGRLSRSADLIAEKQRLPPPLHSRWPSSKEDRIGYRSVSLCSYEIYPFKILVLGLAMVSIVKIEVLVK